MQNIIEIMHMQRFCNFYQEIPGFDVSDKDEAITKAIIVLARNLGLSVIAEGVETKQQIAFLNQQLCDEIQGYYYYKPMPVQKIEELLDGKGRGSSKFMRLANV